ncbi:hypothetical protein [Streptomyces sp. NPDC056853]|uniref:hypothetical protein n=1 Tax=Streptomyces sp. NPDC056853 TaxID=3345958 RepID=UPI003679F795
MAQHDAYSELRRQPPREVGEQGHRVVEGSWAALPHGPGGHCLGDRPDQPPGEIRGLGAGAVYHRVESSMVTREVGQQGVAQQVGPPAQGEALDVARRRTQGG